MVSEERLKQLGIDIYNTTRGGNITYHGPGQVVAYPVFNLRSWKTDLPWFVTMLEEVVIQTLKAYGIEAGRKAAYRGVWVGERKIAAVGIAVKRWITMHGFAFNIDVNKEHFALINPCGIKEFDIVSLEDLAGTVNFSEVLDLTAENFAKIFEADFCQVTPDWLESGEEFAQTGMVEKAPA